MKKTYQHPQIHIVALHGPVVMLGGSQQVKEYRKENDFFIGDVDE